MPLIRCTRGDKRFIQLAARRHAQTAVAKPGALAAFRPKAFVGDRIIDQASEDIAPTRTIGLWILHRD